MEKFKWILRGPGIVALLATCLVFILALVRPENLWERSQAYVAYQAPGPDFHPVIIWDSNEAGSQQSFNVFSAVKDLSFDPPVLAPAEDHVWVRAGLYFVRKDGSIFRDGPPAGLVVAVDSRALVAEWVNRANWIVYKDNKSLRSILERLPELKKIKTTELFGKKTDPKPTQPLLFGIPTSAFPGLAARLFIVCFCLCFWVLLIQERFFDSVPSPSNFILALVFTLSFLVLIIFLTAELRFVEWGWLLFFSFLMAFFFRMFWPIAQKTWNFQFEGGLVFLFLTCLSFTLFNPKFTLDSDIYRYLVQGEILDQYSGWPRNLGLDSSSVGHVFSYPFAVGIFYSGLFSLAGITPDQWPCADWRFSIVVLLNQVAFGILNFLPLALFWESRVVIGRKMSGLLILCCLCLPTFLGRTIGAEGVLWPLLLLLFWGFNPAFPLRPRVQWSYGLALAGFLSLVKHDTGPIFLLLLAPAAVVETLFSKKNNSLKFTLSILLLGLVPLFIFKILNWVSGVVCLDDFNPMSLGILREALPDLLPILKAQVEFLATWKPSLLVYGLLGLGIFLRSRQDSGWTRREWVELLFPVCLYFLAWAGMYLFSKYPSKAFHIFTSFNRLWGPAVLWMAFKVFYKTKILSAGGDHGSNLKS
jgi:hypothetical protein